MQRKINLEQEDIRIKVKLFAAYQEVLNADEIELIFPCRTTVSTVCDYVISEYPELAQWREVTRFGINLQFVDADTVLSDGDEVVLIPPVSGG